MARTPSKPAPEVIEDSEEEHPEQSKKKDSSEAGDASGNDGEGDGTEYEIEAILNAKHGAFVGGHMGYLVKWKGYSEEHNSWVNEEDAQGASEMIQEYWAKAKREKKSKVKPSKSRSRKSDAKADSPDVDEPPSSNKRKKSSSAHKSKSSQPEEDAMEEDAMEEDQEQPKAKRLKKVPRADANEEMDLDATEEYQPMNTSRYTEKSWEKLVQHVDTIEKIDGTLKVFFTLNTGDKVVEPSRVCAKHFPQKMIQFYESNLRWREAEQ